MPKVTWRSSLGLNGNLNEEYTYRWVEQSATDTIERPDVDKQTESIHQGRENIGLAAIQSIRCRIRSCRIARLRCEHHLAHEREVEKHECSDKLARRGDEMRCHRADVVRMAMLFASILMEASVRLFVFEFAWDLKAWHDVLLLIEKRGWDSGDGSLIVNRTLSGCWRCSVDPL